MTWADTPERSNMLMLRLMTWISLRLGRRTARGVLHLIAAYFLLFASASRRASRSYLGRALGRPARWRDLYRHFFTFAATIHDRVYLLNRRFDLFDFEVHGEDLLRRLLADHKGLFLLGAHLGSFEVIRALAARRRTCASPCSCIRTMQRRSTPCWLPSIRRRCRTSSVWGM